MHDQQNLEIIKSFLANIFTSERKFEKTKVRMDRQQKFEKFDHSNFCRLNGRKIESTEVWNT